MKNSLFFLFFLSFFLEVRLLKAQNFDQMFSDANKAYENKNYDWAKQQYQKLINLGIENTNVFYNLGNSFYKLGDYPSAILYYEKAQKLNPGDQEIKDNLKLANLQITDKIEPLPLMITSRFWNFLVLSFKTDTWAWIAVISIVLFGLALSLYWVSPIIWLKKTGFFTALFFLFAGIIAHLLAHEQKKYFEQSTTAIIFDPSLNVKSAPDAESTNLFVIHEGSKIYILESQNQWVKIKISNGNSGWIKNGTFQKI